MAYKCIIFDFDGTIADTEHHVFKIYNHLADKYKYQKMSKDDLQEAKSMSFREWVKSIGVSYIRLPKMLREGQQLLKGSIESVEPFQKNMKDILLDLRSKVEVMGILTANSVKNVEFFLAQHDLEIFDFIESSTLTGKAKKFNQLVKRYNFPKEAVLYIGDEIRDIHECNKANIKCAVVQWGYNHLETLKQHHPDYVLMDLADLLDIVS